MTTLETQKATIYGMHFMGWGHRKIEVKNLAFKTGPYAQYKQAIVVTFIRRNRRKAERLLVTSDVSMVILEGWEHPEFEYLVPFAYSNDTMGKRGRYGSFDIRWHEDFDAFLRDYLNKTNTKVLADFRNHDPEEYKVAKNYDDSDPFIIHTNSNDPSANQEVLNQQNPVLIEGAAHESVLTQYERNPEARRKCIEHYGLSCIICGFDFMLAYGEAGRGFIHVHHLKPISATSEEYIVNPVADLRPVCANCHCIIHRRNPPYTIEDVVQMLKR
jgi:hypothetical protein